MSRYREVINGPVGARPFSMSPWEQALAWTREHYQDSSIEVQNSADADAGMELMTEKLRFADIVSRLTYFPSLTIDDR